VTALPPRWGITLAFTAAMALVLVAIGLFLYLRLEAQLDDSIDNGLRSRAGEVSALAMASAGGLGASHREALIEQEESFAQVLTPAGRIVDSTPQLGGRPVLSAAELARAARQPSFFERGSLPGIEADARLLAVPVRAPEGKVVVAVGSSLGDRDEALGSLAALLAIGGPVAVLLASVAGYWVAGRALRPVEAALERERRFVDDASHELRTPLALHKASLELALRHARSAEELRGAIASGLEEVDRLARLADDLLVVARSEDGELPIDPRPISVAELLAGVGERFAARAAAVGRELTIEPVGGLLACADRSRLEQALSNLVDNALRHGGGEVRLWATAENERVRLNVGDRGPGLPPKLLPHAFERFSRGDPARGRGGSGLGLAIVETIARAHGGRAGIDNDPEGGAVAWIELSRSFHPPRVEPAPSQSQPRRTG
jgi:two-component system OmpR family sensor kinase